MLIQLALLFYVLHRFGAVAYAAATVFRDMMFRTPLTSDFSAWYAPRSAAVLLLMAALVTYAFRISLAGKPIFGDAMLEGKAAA